MENIQSLFKLLTRMQFSDFIDIIVVAFLIYKLLPHLRSSGMFRVAKVLVVVVVVLLTSRFFNLYVLNFILNQVLAVGLIAVVVLFQPELRRMIDHLANVKFQNILTAGKTEQPMAPVIANVVRACEAMNRERVGALIVFSRENHLDAHIKTGTLIDGQVSEHLLRNLFFPKAALHDGAVIIRNDRVLAAGCVLPLSDSNRLSADLGTRHRAGVGMSEASDAVVVIVSEETGAISVAVDGMLKRHLAPQTLEKLLLQELCPKQDDDENLVLKLRQKLQTKEKGEDKHEK